MTSDRAYYHGQYFTKGDIVSVQDIDGGVYYAQVHFYPILRIRLFYFDSKKVSSIKNPEEKYFCFIHFR